MNSAFWLIILRMWYYKYGLLTDREENTKLISFGEKLCPGYVALWESKKNMLYILDELSMHNMNTGQRRANMKESSILYPKKQNWNKIPEVNISKLNKIKGLWGKQY